MLVISRHFIQRPAGILSIALLFALLAATVPSWGRTVLASPATYENAARSLAPGDTLKLQAGTYRNGLRLHDLSGEPGRPIVIDGASGDGSVFLARPDANTVSIKNAAYITVRHLVLDGQGIEADGVKAEGNSRFAHHITLENLTIVNHGADQQIVGISTKCPAWNWVVRGNVIVGAGTGMYFGNSDGRAPFVAGLIEGNTVLDAIGYDLQIKHQLGRPSIEGLPTTPSVTVIRQNVFGKANGGSAGHLARPNVLLGHFPAVGPGADDRYLVYRNFFYENPHEALLQAEGNLDLYANVFINSGGDAIRIQPHKARPRAVAVRHNTIIARDRGLHMRGGEPGYRQLAEANAVFSAVPIQGGEQRANVTGTVTDAKSFLVAPFAPDGALDLSPSADRLRLGITASGDGPEYERFDFYGRAWDQQGAGAILPGVPPPWRLGARALGQRWPASRRLAGE